MNFRLQLLPVSAVLAAASLVTFAAGASAVIVLPPENPTLVLTITTCWDPDDGESAAAGFDVSNPDNNDDVPMDVTVDVPGIGAFSNNALPDGQTQTGGFGGIEPGDYVATATTVAGGTSGPVPFTIEPCATDPVPPSNPGSSFDTGVTDSNTSSSLWVVAAGATLGLLGIGAIARTRRRVDAR